MTVTIFQRRLVMVRSYGFGESTTGGLP
jgi:hypothetical protein